MVVFPAGVVGEPPIPWQESMVSLGATEHLKSLVHHEAVYGVVNQLAIVSLQRRADIGAPLSDGLSRSS